MAGIFSIPKRWNLSGLSTRASVGPNKTRRVVKTIDVAAGLIFRDGKLLVAQRFTQAHLGGLWEFPGGKREAEETFEACLVRELREELGIEVAVGEAVE